MQNGDDVVRAGAHAEVTWNQAALQEQRMSTGSFSSSHCFEGAGYCLPLPLSLFLHQKGQELQAEKQTLHQLGTVAIIQLRQPFLPQKCIEAFLLHAAQRLFCFTFL